MNSTQAADMVAEAKRQMGRPYVWKGKGSYRFSVAGKLANPPAWGMVFDCSGFVGHCVKVATGVDRTMSHAAQTYHDTLTPLGYSVVSAIPAAAMPCLAYFGTGPKDVSHIGILTPEGLYEAAGAGSNCNSPEDAARLNAHVRLTPLARIRRDLVSLSLLP